MANRGASTKTSPAAIEKYLKGIDFPCSKQDLIEYARDNGAPDQVVELMQRFPDRQYNSPADVTRSYGEIV